jgi:5-carboxymethyl-2-hydroxymuconate isomerase
MESPAAFLRKIIKMRKHLLRTKRSGLNQVAATLAIKSIEPWLDAYPKATDQQVCAHILRHLNTVLHIIPGKKNKSGQALEKQLFEILNQTTPHAIPGNKRDSRTAL